MRPGPADSMLGGSLGLNHSPGELLGCVNFGTHCGHQLKLLQSETILKAFLRLGHMVGKLKLHLIFSRLGHHGQGWV